MSKLHAQREKRNFKAIPGWKRTLKHSKFHDLKLYLYTQESTILMVILNTITTMQQLSLLYLKLSDNNRKSNFHRSFYNSFLPYLTLDLIIESYMSASLILISLYLAVKMILFWYFYSSTFENSANGNRSKLYLQILFSLNFIDITILKIPILNFMMKNFFLKKKQNFEIVRILEIFISLLSLFILYVEFAMNQVFSFDFNFKKKNLFFTKTSFKKTLNMIITTTLALLKHIELNNESLSIKILVNFIGILYCLGMIHVFLKDLIYLKSPKTTITHITLLLFFMLECSFGFINLVWPIFAENYDLDYIFIVLILQLTCLSMILYRKRINEIKSKYLEQIQDSVTADLYMDIITNFFENKNKSESRVNLLAVLKQHVERCKNTQCLCTLVKYNFGKLRGRTVGQELKREARTRNWLKVAVYDNERTITEISNSHKNSFKSKDSHREAINLDCYNIKQVFSNFYFTLSRKMKDDSFRLFCSYFSYSIFECTNCVGAMIAIYNYIFSLSYRMNQSNFRNLILQNYIDLTSSLLNHKFLNSDVDISRERFSQVYEYLEKIQKIQSLVNSTIEKKVKYFNEFSETKINFMKLLNHGFKIIQAQENIEEMFETLFKTSKNNLYLIKTYIEYQKKFFFKSIGELKEQTERLRYIVKKSQLSKTLAEYLTRENKFNLFSHENKVVFINIYKNQFTVSKFSNNFPNFFEYGSHELKGMLLKHLMPPEIRRYHDSYVSDFLNRRTGSRLRIPHLVTFGQAKTGELKMMGIVIKLEFFMIDDIYLCGLINSHRRNSQRLVLSHMDGKVISVNQRAYKILGEKIFRENYSLFLSIPNLLKYYYPEVVNITKAKGISGKKHYEYVKEQNYSSTLHIEGEKVIKDSSNLVENYSVKSVDFRCFLFKVFLSAKMNLQTSYKKRGLNISQLSLWSIFKDKSNLTYNKLYPKHLQILSRVIAKNRDTFKNNLTNIFRVRATLESYRYKNGLEFKLLVLSDLTRVGRKTASFFKAAAMQEINKNMADILLVSPGDINNLCKPPKFFYFFKDRLLKIERQLVEVSKTLTLGTNPFDNKSIMRKEPLKNGRREERHLPYLSNTSEGRGFTDLICKADLVCYSNIVSDVEVDNEKKIENFDLKLEKYNFAKNVTTKFSLRRRDMEERREQKNISIASIAEESMSEKGVKRKRSQTVFENKSIKEKNINFPFPSSNQQKKFRSEIFNDKKLNEKILTLDFKKSIDSLVVKQPLPTIMINSERNFYNSEEKPKNKIFFKKKLKRNNTPVHGRAQDNIMRQGIPKLGNNKKNFLDPGRSLFTRTPDRKVLHIAKKLGEKLFKTQEKFKDLVSEHRSLLKNSGILTVMNTIKSIMRVEDLKRLEEKYSEEIDKSSDNISSHLEKEIKLFDKELPQLNKNNKAKFGIHGDANIQYQMIKFGIKEKLGNVNQTKVELCKQFLLLFLLIVSFVLRFQVNNIMNSDLSNLEQGIFSRKISIPILFFHKEMTKLRLIRNGYLNQSDITDQKLFDFEFFVEMKSRIRKQNSVIRDWKDGNLASKRLKFSTKFKNSDLKYLENINFLTLYNSISLDYQTFIRNFDQETGVLKKSEYFNLESSIENSLAVMNILIESKYELYKKYQELLKQYNTFYLFFMMSNVILSVGIGILLFLIRINFVNEIKKLSELLLKIEKKYIIVFRNRFKKFRFGAQEKLKRDKFAPVNLRGSKRIRTKLGTTRWIDHEIPEFKAAKQSLFQKLKNEENEQFDEKFKKVVEMKDNNSKTFSIFINFPKSSKGFTFFLTILAVILVSIPLGIDFSIQQSQISSIKILHDVSNQASSLSINFYALYSIFYTKIYGLYKDDILVEKKYENIFRKISENIDKRSFLQTEITINKKLELIQNSSYCGYLDLDEDMSKLCEISTSRRLNFDVFLGMSDLLNFYETAISSIQASPDQNVISNDNFRTHDLSIYFVSKAMKKLNEETIELAKTLTEENLRLSSIFFISFPVVLIVYYYLYKIIWFKKTLKIVKKLQNTFLALPPRIVNNNSYIKNYFLSYGIRKMY